VSGGVTGVRFPSMGKFEVPPRPSGAVKAGKGTGGGPTFGQLRGGIKVAGEGILAFLGGGGYFGGGGKGIFPLMPGRASMPLPGPLPGIPGRANIPGIPPALPPGIGGSGKGAGTLSKVVWPTPGISAGMPLPG